MTRKLTALVSCLAAAFAVSAIVSAMSSASMVLPVFSGTQETAEGAATKLVIRIQGGATYICTAGVYALIAEVGRHLGPAILHDTGCTQGGESCRSLGDAAGVILITGTWHLVLNGGPGATDIHLFLILLTELHIECAGAAVKLILLTGNWQGRIVQRSGSKSAFTVSVGTVNGEGKVQNFSEFENDAGTGIKTSIEAKQEGGKAKPAFEESEDVELTFGGETSIEK
jgi:hypothetical protein